VKTIRLRVTGIEPGLLMNNPKGSMRAGPSSGRQTQREIPTPEVEAERATYRLKDGQMYVWAKALRDAIVDGGAGTTVRMGRTNKGTNTVLDAILFQTHEECPLVHPDTGAPLNGGKDEPNGYEVDTRRVRVQDEGVLRSRPLIRQWQTELELEWDEEVLPEAEGGGPPKVLLTSIQRGGRTVGICDFRPKPPPKKRGPSGHGGRFGRFTVEVISIS
jgi:hypothetical protein